MRWDGGSTAWSYFPRWICQTTTTHRAPREVLKKDKEVTKWCLVFGNAMFWRYPPSSLGQPCTYDIFSEKFFLKLFPLWCSLPWGSCGRWDVKSAPLPIFKMAVRSIMGLESAEISHRKYTESRKYTKPTRKRLAKLEREQSSSKTYC